MDFLFDALTLATLAHVFLAVTIEKWPMSPAEGRLSLVAGGRATWVGTQRKVGAGRDLR